ncbi:MAG TPA: DUF2723 domain-containing protein, partial [Patescibacteria group bacterium]|nr:DUF2723 domain-containing protein [Patescibacteria group bacterium]
FNKRFIPLYLFVFLLVLYISNLSRSVYGGDVGDLVTSSFVAGVPHPPGYPFFTLVGFLLTRVGVLFHWTPAFAVGLISAVTSAFAVFLYYKHVYLETKNHLISLISSLILSFTYLFWFYAEIGEVFALNNFFVVLLIFLVVRFLRTHKINYLYFLSFFAGLAFTNHQTIVLIFPSLLLLIAPDLWSLIRTKRKELLWVIILPFVGFSVYLYAIIASLHTPVIDWLHMRSWNDLSSFMFLILRRQYGTLQAGPFPPPDWIERLLILKNYFIAVGTQLTLPVIVLSLVGVGYLLRKKTLVGISLLLAYILSGPVFIAYAGFPLVDVFRFGVYERFICMSAVLVMFFFPYGLVAFANSLKKIVRTQFIVVIELVFLLIPVMLFVYNFPKTNLSSVFVGDNLGRDYLDVLPKNSLLLLSGDTTLFNTWYMHYARGVRPDVTLMNSLDPYKSNVLLAKKFPHMQSGKSFTDAVNALKNNIASLSATVTVVSDIQIRGHNTTFTWIPYGLAFQLIMNKSDLPSHEAFLNHTMTIWSQLHVPSSQS